MYINFIEPYNCLSASIATDIFPYFNIICSHFDIKDLELDPVGKYIERVDESWR